MEWDPNVMRKFATTSHQRLIYQLRGELASSHRAQQLPAAVLESDGSAPPPARSSAASQKQEKRPRSFRDRLDTIEMR